MWDLLEAGVHAIQLIGVLADDKTPAWAKIILLLVFIVLGLAICWVITTPR